MVKTTAPVTKNGDVQQKTADGKKVVLGKKYRDTVHGIEGVATINSIFLQACDRVTLEYVKDGDVKSITFDVLQLEEVKDAPVAKVNERTTGGPERGTGAR